MVVDPALDARIRPLCELDQCLVVVVRHAPRPHVASNALEPRKGAAPDLASSWRPQTPEVRLTNRELSLPGIFRQRRHESRWQLRVKRLKCPPSNGF